MKTTIELSDALFEAAKQRAKARHTTLRAIVEDGLRRVLSEEAASPRKPFRLTDARVHGRASVSGPDAWRDVETDQVAGRIAHS